MFRVDECRKDVYSDLRVQMNIIRDGNYRYGVGKVNLEDGYPKERCQSAWIAVAPTFEL